LDRLAHPGYGYWALGHIHKREHDERQGVHVVFPGNLQGRDVGETGSKGATFVDYDSSEIIAVTHRDLSTVRWTRLELDLSAVTGVDEVLERVTLGLEDLQASSEAELHAVRVVLNAPTSVAQDWARSAERLESQLRADAAGDSEDLWLERIEVQALADSREEIPGEAVAAVRDALASLRDHTDSAERSRLTGLLAGLRSRFGPELKEVVQQSAGILDEAQFDQLLDAAETLLLAELEEGA
jgi:DNA repair exonuclease SbcCD nuclease subunit